MARQDYQQEPRHNRTAESDHADLDGRRGQLGRNQLHRQQEPQTPMYQDEPTGRELERRLSSADGVLKNDGTGTTTTGSTGADADRTESTAGRFTADVREYTAGYAERQTSIQNVIREYQRDRPDPKREIEQLDTACKQLERANTELREATKQVEEMNRSYNNDIRLGR